MASEYDIDCPVCGASVKGESLLKHLRKFHKLDEASVKAEYSKVSRLIKRRPRRSNILKVRCVSCDAVLLHNNIPEHVKRVHKHESAEQQDMIKTQSRANLVNLQSVDAQPQGLVEPQVPPAPVNVDNVTADAQPKELVERQVRPAPVNVLVDTYQDSDCPMCPAHLKYVRCHLRSFHGKTKEEIKTILSMASEYDIDCQVCGASVKGESLLKHLRKFHKLDEATVKAEYSKVSRLIKRRPRRSNILKVRCVSCDAVLLHNNIPEHVKRVHKHKSAERQDMIKTQSRANLVNLQAVDAQPQGLVEPQVPPAPVNVDNVTADAQPQELVERQVRPAPVNVLVDTNQESDCPMCPARLKDVRCHLRSFHGKTNEEIKKILTVDQRRRAHLQLTYKTSEIFGTLEQLPVRQGECYTGEGLVAMGSVIDLLRRLGVNMHQDIGPPVVGTRAHQSAPVNQPQIDNAFFANLMAAALQQQLSTEPDGQIPGTSVAPENPQSDMDQPDTQAPTSVEQPTENTADNDSDNESLKPLSSRIVERDNPHSSEMDDSDSQEPDEQISGDHSSIKVEVMWCSVMTEDIQSPPNKRIRFDQPSISEPRTTPSRATKKRPIPQYSSSEDDSDSDRDSSVRVSKRAKRISSSSEDFDSDRDGVTGGSTDDDSNMEPSGAINSSSPSGELSGNGEQVEWEKLEW